MSLTNRINVVVIKESGFPNGMAPVQRLRLLSRCLVDQGAKVTILCIKAIDRAPFIENYSSKGNVDGINYEYTTGTPFRANNFFIRRWSECKGLVLALVKVTQFKRLHKIDSIYLWMEYICISRIIITILAKFLNIPIVLEINERPESLTENPGILSKLFSTLWGASGGIIISEFLLRWCREAAKLEKRNFTIIKIPILIDPIISTRYEPLTSTPSVLFASSPGYDQTIKFILDAMDVVWVRIPDCKLLITGWGQTDKRGDRIRSELMKRSTRDQVDLLGYLPRDELLKQYQRSWALLIPLFQDNRSKARFPTKIGEYLVSSRPIITTEVGEIPSFFHDGVNAYVCEPDNPVVFGFKIIEALIDPEQAKIVGQQGVITSQKCFDYRLYSKDIYDFFFSLRHP